jgi:hypothetical protein
MEKWNELCFILSKSISPNLSETVFEQKVIQALEKLGWSYFKGEISVQESIQVGSSGRITPDIIIKSNEINLFVIDVKRPSDDLKNPSHQKQLLSYMRMLSLDFGMLIGNKIQLFLDGKFFNTNGIVLIDEIEFKRDNEKGLKFVELFSKVNYNKQDIEEHAQEKIQQLKEIEDFKKLKNQLLSENYNEKIIDFLKTELLKEYDEKIIEKVFKILEIKIENKNKIVPLENFERRRTKKYSPIENFNEPTGKLPIGKYVRKTFNDLVKNNLIDRSEIERLQRGDYSKSTFDIQFPFLAKENSPYYERIRYWKNPYHINGEVYFVCSQWYEVPANNDRPFYEGWLRKMKKGN